MNQEQFAVLMPYIVADLVGVIAEKRSVTAGEAVSLLYHSQLYSVLAREDTKVWYYSTPMLYSLFEQEMVCGEIEFPDV